MQLVDLRERKILITGASSGIGRATALLVSQLGASVVLCARDASRLLETLEMMDSPQKHRCIPFDVTDFDKYDEVFTQAVSDGKKIDGLVHCAGIARPLPIRSMSPSAVLAIMDVNFHSFLHLVHTYTKKKYGCGGSIVAVSAANSHYPQTCMSVYAASKAALEASIKTMALELAAQKIRINCVAPGAVDTPMTQMADEDALDKILDKQLLGMGKPKDIANMIAFLLSDASSFITGRAMFVDGGLLGQ